MKFNMEQKLSSFDLENYKAAARLLKCDSPTDCCTFPKYPKQITSRVIVCTPTTPSVIILKPTYKAPVVFTGQIVYKFNFETGEDEWFGWYELYVTNQNKLVFVESLPDLSEPFEPPQDGERYVADLIEKTRVRLIETYDDVWTFGKHCEKDMHYKQFLENISLLLTKTEHYFWLPY